MKLLLWRWIVVKWWMRWWLRLDDHQSKLPHQYKTIESRLYTECLPKFEHFSHLQYSQHTTQCTFWSWSRKNSESSNTLIYILHSMYNNDLTVTNSIIEVDRFTNHLCISRYSKILTNHHPTLLWIWKL